MNSQGPHYPAGRLFFACAFESLLLLIAYVLGLFTAIDPFETARLDWQAVLIGLIAVFPMLVLLWWGLHDKNGIVGKVTTQARDFVTQFLDGFGIAGYAIISLLAGIGEEALFRGYLQSFIGAHSNELVALIAASFLFGLAHAVSRFYMVVATVIGVYLGLLYNYTDNILVPVISHAVYDFIALIWLTRSKRAR